MRWGRPNTSCSRGPFAPAKQRRTNSYLAPGRRIGHHTKLPPDFAAGMLRMVLRGEGVAFIAGDFAFAVGAVVDSGCWNFIAGAILRPPFLGE